MIGIVRHPASQSRNICRALSQRKILRSARGYPTQSSLGRDSSSGRKQVTVINDDGRVRWGQLSTREKAARTTQQTFNFLVVFAGAAGTVGVITILYLYVFSSESQTSYFNRAADRLKKDSRCIELLGDGKEIDIVTSPGRRTKASTRARNELDKQGTEHLYMKFYAEGPKSTGVVNLHMTKKPGQSHFEYKYFTLEVPGHPTVFLENADARLTEKSSGLKILGVRWR